VLKELLAEEVKEPVLTEEWRASEAGECETFLCRLRLGHPAIPFTGRVRHMLDDGLMHEHDIVDRIRSKGFKVLHSYSEGQMVVTCYDRDGIVVRGHPDGVIDAGGGPVVLDYADDKFRLRSRYYGLEVTAPSHFQFLRIERDHLRSELPRKFVQIQMYLNSEELRTYSDCMVVIVKNKNTSALYEEGISLDTSVVDETIEKLKRVGDLVSRGEVSPYRCDDWRRHYCRYREQCFGAAVGAEVITPAGILEGETLNEAGQLLEAEQLWLKGKALEDDAKELIEEARAVFDDVISEYGAKGLTVGKVKALMVESSRRSCAFDILKQRYPTVYDEVVEETVSRYLRVSRR
jgi:hypothetical protein